MGRVAVSTHLSLDTRSVGVQIPGLSVHGRGTVLRRSGKGGWRSLHQCDILLFRALLAFRKHGNLVLQANWFFSFPCHLLQLRHATDHPPLRICQLSRPMASLTVIKAESSFDREYNDTAHFCVEWLSAATERRTRCGQKWSGSGCEPSLE